MCHLGSFSSAQGGQGLPWGPRSPGWGVGNREWWGRSTKQVPLINCLSHSIQNLVKSKVKEEEHWTRLRRYSLLLQKEDLKK